MIKLIALGNLGRDAEVKDVSGKKVIEFSIAHSEKYTDRNGQQQERTTWVRCSYWRENDRVGVAEYLKKGKRVFVEGVPQVTSYTTKEGQPGASLDLRVTNLELASDRQESSQSGASSAPAPAPAPPPAQRPQPIPAADAAEQKDDLPF
jgi:single-strand DNA-binding protein